MVPSTEEYWAQGNTPDFMLEYFIVHLSDDTRSSLTVMAIQLCTFKAEPKIKPCNDITIIRHRQYCTILRLLQLSFILQN